MPPRSMRRMVSGSSVSGACPAAWSLASSAAADAAASSADVVVCPSAGGVPSAVAVVPVEEASAAAAASVSPASAVAEPASGSGGSGSASGAMTPMRSGFAAFAVDRFRVRLGGFGVSSGVGSGIGSDLEHRG